MCRHTHKLWTLYIVLVNVSTLKLCYVGLAPLYTGYVMPLTFHTRPSHFPVHTLKSWEWPGDKAMLCSTYVYVIIR